MLSERGVVARTKSGLSLAVHSPHPAAANQALFILPLLRQFAEKEDFFVFRSSLKELKSIKMIVLCGVLIAAAAALEALNPFNLGDLIKIRLDFVATALMGFFVGPVAGAFAAGIGDIIRFLAKPVGAFFPGYTLSAILGGFIYGYFLYRKSTPYLKKPWADLLLRCTLAKLCINVFVNIGLNTLWVTMTQGKAFTALLPLRVIKNFAALPIEVAVMFLVMWYVTKYFKKKQI